MRRFFGTRDFYRMVAALALPMLLQSLITTFVSLLDNLMVGQIGTEQMSGVAIINQILFVVNLCTFGLTGGAGIYGAQFHGKGDVEGLRANFRYNLWFSLLIAFAAGFLIYFAQEPLIATFLHDTDGVGDLVATLGYGKDYLKIMLWSFLPFALSNAYVGVLRVTGNTKLPMIAGAAAVGVNMMLNWVLIFGKLGFPVMGVRGAALATTISRYVELVVIVLAVHMNTGDFPFARGLYKTLRISRTLLWRLSQKALPLMCNELFWSLGQTVLMQCYSIRGLSAVAALNITNVVSNLFMVTIHTLGNCVAIILGNQLGAGHVDEAKQTSPRLNALSLMLCCITGTLLFLAAPLFPQLYNTSETVQDLAVRLIRVQALLYPIISLSVCSYFTMRAGGRVGITILFDCAFSWCIFVPTAYLLAHYTGLNIVSLFAIINGLELIKAVLGITLMRKGVWARNIVADA